MAIFWHVSKETGTMMLTGMNSWIQSATGGAVSHPGFAPKRSALHPGAARAGIAAALVALTLLMGIGRPAETAAYKSESLVCSTIEAGFQYTFDKALTAKLAGDTKGFEYWNGIAQAAQGLWYDAGCGAGSGGGWRSTT
jgi:hypothetical protein